MMNLSNYSQHLYMTITTIQLSHTDQRSSALAFQRAVPAFVAIHVVPHLHQFNMVYNWDGKEAECYQLYVQEKKSLNEVLEYWEQRGFTPRYVIA
jgi:hypothetical protein